MNQPVTAIAPRLSTNPNLRSPRVVDLDHKLWGGPFHIEGQPCGRSGAYHRGMQLKPQRVSTGTFCGGNHPEEIEYRYALVDGVEIPSGQSSPRCFRAGCPDNVAAMAREQRAGRPKL